MRIDILTLFPEMFAPLSSSIIGRARDEKKLTVNIVNIRDYSLDKHKKCDDYPFGGGAGMVMTPQPITSAFEAVDPRREAYRIYMSPKGRTLTQKEVPLLAGKEWLILLCGHYEGVDQRALDLNIDDEISIGDYILTGGELPAMVLTDAVSRYLPEVLHSDISVCEESFSEGLLEYPQYTRPNTFRGLDVPEVLLSGHHANIARWRKERAEELTEKLRPDLIRNKKD